MHNLKSNFNNSDNSSPFDSYWTQFSLFKYSSYRNENDKYQLHQLYSKVYTFIDEEQVVNDTFKIDPYWLDLLLFHINESQDYKVFISGQETESFFTTDEALKYSRVVISHRSDATVFTNINVNIDNIDLNVLFFLSQIHYT